MVSVHAALLAEIDQLRATNKKLIACRDELREATLAMNDATINNTRTLSEAITAMRAENEKLRRLLRRAIDLDETDRLKLRRALERAEK